MTFWYSLMTLQGMQFLVLLGLSPTITRATSYAMNGAKQCDLHNGAVYKGGARLPNRELLSQLVRTMSAIHVMLSLVWFLICLLVGLLLLPNLTREAAPPLTHGLWVAWGVYSITSAFRCHCWLYSSYLLGTGEITTCRRRETAGWALAAALQLPVLLHGGSILLLTIVFQAAQLGIGLALRHAARNQGGMPMRGLPTSQFSFGLLMAIWSQSWRSAVGQFLSLGLTQATGLFYASVGKLAHASSYLLALTLLRQLSLFAQVPFYSHIPELTYLRARGERAKFARLAARTMTASHWILLSGVIIFSIMAPPLFTLLHSNTPPPPPLLWALLASALFLERFSGMHMQLYTTSNRVLWHIANGVTAAITIVTMVWLFPYFGVYAFPAAAIAGQLGFGVWYSASLSYASMETSSLRYERGVALPCAVVLVAWLIIQTVCS